MNTHHLMSRSFPAGSVVYSRYHLDRAHHAATLVPQSG